MTEDEAALRQRLPEVWKIRYGSMKSLGWNVRLRQEFQYYTPDEWYSAALYQYVTAETIWLDVGCGRHILPQNDALARILADSCKLLYGIDPSDNVNSNPFLHRHEKCLIESFRTDLKFDLITLRMVAEHIADPQSAVAALVKLLAPNGRIIIYTVWKWSPASITAAITPMSIHHAMKRFLWNAEERDTFPVVYGMNTRAKLRRLFAANNLQEEFLLRLDDCRSFQRWRWLSATEFILRGALRKVGLRYPESCLLAVFKRPA